MTLTSLEQVSRENPLFMKGGKKITIKDVQLNQFDLLYYATLLEHLKHFNTEIEALIEDLFQLYKKRIDDEKN